MTNIWRLRDRTKAARETGAVAIEFALLMAFLPLTILACGIVDYGEFMAQATKLAAVVRGAAEYARGQVAGQIANGRAIAPPTAADLSNLLGVPAEVFTTSTYCTCADNTRVICPGAGARNPCDATADKRVLTYVVVSGSQTYTPIVPGIWSSPGPVNARTVLRAK